MRFESPFTNGFGLIIAALVFAGIFLAVTGYADSVQAELSPNTTGELLPVNITNTTSVTDITPITIFPPTLVVDRVEVDNVTCTVYGSAMPGSANETIITLRWNWGDNSTPEEHGFPNSHDYHDPGTYILTVTAEQSDGQYASRSRVIDLSLDIIPEITLGNTTSPLFMLPAGPGIGASAPTLTLLEPVVSRMNVTLNGNLNPGGPGVTISSVIVDWNDGYSTDYPDLPVTHHYSAGGMYTINVTGIQSDGQSTVKRISVALQSESPVHPGPVMSNPPPEDTPVFLIILATAVVVVILAIGIQRVFHRRRDSGDMPDIPKTVSVQEDLYYQAKAKGDMQTAAASAHVCAQMFRTFAEKTPGKREFYLEMTEKWEKIAKSTGMNAPGGYTHRRTPAGQEQMPSAEDLERICSGTDVDPKVVDAVIRVAMEIAREGREGQAVGTSFVVGDTEIVMNHSRQFVLNPFHGHKEEKRKITDAGIRGNIKEFAQLDGAFIVTGNGIVEAAGRYLTADMSQVKVPEGLGSRHSSIAGITLVTKSVGIVVSQSGGLISIFKNGKIVDRIQS